MYLLLSLPSLVKRLSNSLPILKIMLFSYYGVWSVLCRFLMEILYQTLPLQIFSHTLWLVMSSERKDISNFDGIQLIKIDCTCVVSKKKSPPNPSFLQMVCIEVYTPFRGNFFMWCKVWTNIH